MSTITEHRRYLSRAEAATMSGYSVGTLANMASTGTGPKYVKPNGGRVLYPLDDFLAWLEGVAA